ANVKDKKTASKGALNMLKADFNLWMYSVENAGDSYLQNAEDAVNSVINSAYSLETNYNNIFETSTETGREVIFAWNYKRDEYTGGYPIDFQFNSATVSPIYHFNPIAVGIQQQWTFYTDAYVQVLTENIADTRLATNYLTFYDDLMGQLFHWTNKYRGSWVNNTLILDSDIILYRLADAYLFDAEIKNYRGDASGAIQSVNKLVERAYGVPNYYSTGVSNSEAKDIIVKESMKEFPAEGKLWWDLIRFDVIFDVNPYLAGKQNSENILLWPLSDNSINDNPNLGGQTPGWE
ncbi:MAG: RagB/SusD family nutrient uptake outer membrane protein, partial [Ignavibacteriae bacterium]|nr:RagB/SusD family nutrient uptake outer membrane protein [Ignavibacteriota bacterium]